MEAQHAQKVMKYREEGGERVCLEALLKKIKTYND